MRFVPRRLVRTGDASRGATSLADFLKNALGVAVTLLALYFALGLAADAIAATIPESWEARIFAGPMAGELEPTPDLERAQAILDKLTRHGGLRPLPYRLFLIDLEGPNAIAVPGGGIGVTPALLERIHTETGLAAVLAHELGHHQGRHGLKKLGRSLILGTARYLLFGGNTGRLAQASVDVAESGHSRRHEREADDFGLRLVHAAYGHADDALEFYELILQEHGHDEGRWNSFLASHPLTYERIVRLETLRDRLEATPP